MPSGVVFFDVDGTLVPGTSSSAHLARYLGHDEALRELDEAYLAGRLHNSQIAIRDAAAYAGRSRQDLACWLEALPLIDGITEVVAWCHERDLLTVLTTLAWEPVGQYLCTTLGFSEACGPRLAESDGRFTGAVAAHLTPEGRRDFALAVCKREGLSPSRAVAIGDSVSDLPLFREVGLAVAGLTVASLAAFWGPLGLLVVAMLAYGSRRDRGLSTRSSIVVAAVSALVLTATTAFVGWGAYQQQRAEQDACTPSTDC